MDRQTDGQITQTGRTKLTNRTGYTCIYGRKTRTDGQTGWTDKRTNWMNEPDGRTTWRTDWWTGKKDRVDGQTDWMNGRKDRRTGGTDQADRKDGSNGLDGRTDAPKSWIKRTKGQTRGHMERTHGQMNWIKRPDGRTDWSPVLCGSDVQIILSLIRNS